MCCFVVPMAEAIAATVVRRRMEKSLSVAGGDSRDNRGSIADRVFKVSKLETMLWGGTVLLIVDHIINGELTWRFPFFTGDPSEVLHEILTTGVAMSAVCTVVWAVWAKLSKKATLATA